MNSRRQTDLFAATELPAGMQYLLEFLSRREEFDLLEELAKLPLQHSRYRQFTAKRRTLSYGFSYDFTHGMLEPAPPVADFLLPLRARVAAIAQLGPAEFEQALVTEYQPGVSLGWHRDVPEFEVVAGVSLASACRMRLRPYPPRANKREGVIVLELEPRSLYVLRDAARWSWQHSIPRTKALRYSITFRTRRRTRGAESTRRRLG